MAALLNKVKLLKGLVLGGKAFTGPFYVTIDVTRCCNISCACCRWHSPYGKLPSPGNQSVQDIPLDMFKKLCEELRDMGTESMTLTGEGEPLLHSDLFEMIYTAKKMGFVVKLTTNGILLTENIIMSLIDSELDVLEVSMWENSKEGYERNYPGTSPVTFDKVATNLKRLKTLKQEKGSVLPALSIHQPINKFNYRTIDASVDFAQTNGCDELTFAPLIPWPEEFKSFSLSKDEEKSVCELLVKIKSRLKKNDLKHNIDIVLMGYATGKKGSDILPCYVAWVHAHIKVDGTILPCCAYEKSLGNINENSFKEIWNNSRFSSFRKIAATVEGLAEISEYCCCTSCCYIKDNYRIYRWLKWFRSKDELMGS